MDFADIIQYPFMQRAFIIGTIAAVPLGLIGTFVVVRRIGYLAGAIAHCALGGIGIGLYLQYVLAATVVAAFVPPTVTALTVTVLAALFIGIISIRGKEREDTLISAVWVVGLAIGLILLDKTPGNANISSFLFGDIILLTLSDVYVTAVLSGVVLTLVLIFFQRLEAVCFDAEFAQLRGIHTAWYFQLLLVLTAVTVVLFVRIIGIILLIAMLTLPAATACQFAKRLFPIACLAVLFGMAASWIGLILSVVASSIV
ncbi:putative metal transport system membrane protein [Planctomycetales bacterium]|nr:putative metal transport system membrane protein [Planctomycetales bacterium]